MHVNDVSGQVVDAAMKVHTALGRGCSNRLTRFVFSMSCGSAGSARSTRSACLHVIYDGLAIDVGYRIDLLVEDVVVVELKAIDAVALIHAARLLTCLKLSGRKSRPAHQLQCFASERWYQAARRGPMRHLTADDPQKNSR